MTQFKDEKDAGKRLAEHIAGRGATAARVLGRAARLQQLSESLQAMNADWAAALRVGNIRDGAAIVYADNAAAATRARLEAQRIADRLQAEGVDCRRLVIRVRPKRYNPS